MLRFIVILSVFIVVYVVLGIICMFVGLELSRIFVFVRILGSLVGLLRGMVSILTSNRVLMNCRVFLFCSGLCDVIVILVLFLVSSFVVRWLMGLVFVRITVFLFWRLFRVFLIFIMVVIVVVLELLELSMMEIENGANSVF